MRSMAIQVSALIGVAVLGVPLAAAQNLVANGDFDADVDGWTNMGGSITLSWDGTSDFEGQPNSGSAKVLNNAPAQSASGVTHCVEDIFGNEFYDLSAWLRSPTGQSADGDASVFVWWYTEPGCTGTQSSGPSTPHFTTSDEWVLQEAPSVQAPLDSRSAIVYLAVSKRSEDPGEYLVSFDHVTMTGKGVDRRLSFVPAAGFAFGYAGSFWITDLEVNNPNTEALTYELWWLPRGEENSEPLKSNLFILNAEESNWHQNVLGEVFGLDPEDAPFGALAIASDREGAIAMARVFNQPTGNAAGTFGQAIPGVSVDAMIRQDERRRILFMSEDDEFRANVGCQNASAASLRVSIELFDTSGNSYGLETLDLAPYSNHQINRVFRDWAPISGYVDVWSTTPYAMFYCYGSVLDNTSSDPTTVLPQ